MAEIRWTEQALDYNSKLLYEDQLSALQQGSNKGGERWWRHRLHPLACDGPDWLPTNLMVFGPGGYRFADFIKVGVPLNIMFVILANIVIPCFWSF
jgi:hypothetical protein